MRQTKHKPLRACVPCRALHNWEPPQPGIIAGAFELILHEKRSEDSLNLNFPPLARKETVFFCKVDFGIWDIYFSN